MTQHFPQRTQVLAEEIRMQHLTAADFSPWPEGGGTQSCASEGVGLRAPRKGWWDTPGRALCTNHKWYKTSVCPDSGWWQYAHMLIMLVYKCARPRAKQRCLGRISKSSYPFIWVSTIKQGWERSLTWKGYSFFVYTLKGVYFILSRRAYKENKNEKEKQWDSESQSDWKDQERPHGRDEVGLSGWKDGRGSHGRVWGEWRRVKCVVGVRHMQSLLIGPTC